MTDKHVGSSPGLLQSLTVLATTLVAIVHTRLELLSADLEEDREHLISLLMLSLSAFFCLTLGILMATLLLVALYWETNRILVLGLLVAFFLLAGSALWAYTIQKAKTKPRIFLASLLELFKDHEQLNQHE